MTAIVGLLLFVPWTFLASVAMWISGALFGEASAKWLHRVWALGTLRLFGITLRVEGLPNVPAGPKIYAANHESVFDIPVLGALPLPFSWISKQEIKRIPVFGRAATAMGTLFLRRDGTQADRDTMRDVEERIRAGHVTAIFPEGTRSRTGQLQPMRKGAFRLAQNTGVPLVPIAIVGTFPIAPPGKPPQRRGHEVIVRIGVPLSVPPGAPLEPSMERFDAELRRLLRPFG